jgi:hypothetical protein
MIKTSPLFWLAALYWLAVFFAEAFPRIDLRGWPKGRFSADRVGKVWGEAAAQASAHRRAAFRDSGAAGAAARNRAKYA